MLKQASNQGTRFLAFGEWKRMVLQWRNSSATAGDKPVTALAPVESLIGGVLCGSLSVLVNNPVDVVKTRMQGIEASKYSVACYLV
jgi:solute carrier family 25 citrate transporter 1